MLKNCIYIHELNIQKGPALSFSANGFYCNNICVFFFFSFKAAHADINQGIWSHQMTTAILSYCLIYIVVR